MTVGNSNCFESMVNVEVGAVYQALPLFILLYTDGVDTAQEVVEQGM